MYGCGYMYRIVHGKFSRFILMTKVVGTHNLPHTHTADLLFGIPLKFIVKPVSSFLFFTTQKL